jgi:hypothetical protein
MSRTLRQMAATKLAFVNLGGPSRDSLFGIIDGPAVDAMDRTRSMRCGFRNNL